MPVDQPIPWTELQTFHVLALAGQLAAAAVRLDVDATTVSRRVRKLETRLSSALFEQTRSGHALTEAGERLLAHVEEMQSAASLIQDMSESSYGMSGSIRLSVSEGFGTWFVANVLAEFSRLHPTTTVELVATSGFLSPSKRETDIAIMLARPRAGPVVSRKLSDYRLRLYAARRHVAVGENMTSLTDLQRHTLVGYIPDLLYAPELRYLEELDPSLAPTLMSSSINAQYRLIASGAGIGMLPRFIGDADPSLQAVLPSVEITRSFWIVTHQDTRQIKRVRTFHDWLSRTVAERQRTLLGHD